MKTIFISIAMLFITGVTFSQLQQVKIGSLSSENKELQLKLTHKNQRNYAKPSNETDIFETAINSPKSATFTADGSKYYIQSLEGYQTVVFDAKTHKKIKEITHKFDNSNQHLFKNKEYTLFDYQFPSDISNHNIFMGKPVEACLSANGDWLFVTYYRRSFDTNAQYPSALCVIDTKTDEIVRVLPTAALPKMIAASPDGKHVAVTNWGDNTVAILDVSTNNPDEFKYTNLLEVDKRAVLNYGSKPVDRDNNCGSCLRGTAFTPDGKYLLVGKMGGVGQIAIFRTSNFSRVGKIVGIMNNVRHIVVDEEHIYMSINRSGHVQKLKWSDVRYHFDPEIEKTITAKDIKSVHVGTGARTIDLDPKSEYIFAAVNNQSKIVVVRNSDLQIITEIPADSYPVGLAVSPDGKNVIVTAQGKADGGGNSVMVYEIIKK